MYMLSRRRGRVGQAKFDVVFTSRHERSQGSPAAAAPASFARCFGRHACTPHWFSRTRFEPRIVAETAPKLVNSIRVLSLNVPRSAIIAAVNDLTSQTRRDVRTLVVNIDDSAMGKTFTSAVTATGTPYHPPSIGLFRSSRTDSLPPLVKCRAICIDRTVRYCRKRASPKVAAWLLTLRNAGFGQCYALFAAALQPQL